MLNHQSKRRAWHRMTFLSLMLAVLAFSVIVLSVSVARAYQQKGETVKADSGNEEKDDVEADETSPESQSFLQYMMKGFGRFFGPLFLLLSFVTVALVTMNILQVRRDIFLPDSFIKEFENKLTVNDLQGAYETARNDESFVARVLVAGLSKLNRGYSEAIEAMQEIGEDENMHLEQQLSYLSLIGSVAPMIGLTGTVYGMINSFRVIATSPTSPKPSELAEGISMALFTTLGGLAVAILAIVFYSIFRNRVARFVLEVGIVSEGLMNRFTTVGKQHPAGSAASARTSMAPKQE